MPKIINIDNFAGGKNLIMDQVLIDPSECASASKNVWAPYGALVPSPGVTRVATFTATAETCYGMFADPTINSSFEVYYRLTTAGNFTRAYPWAGESDSLTPLGYTTGTVAVGGVSATGTGTSWSSHASAGDRFRVNTTAGRWSIVASVEDDTHITISDDFGTVGAGEAYMVLPAMTPHLHQSWASLDGSIWTVSTGEIMQRYDGTGVTRISAAPKAAFLQVFKNYLFAARTLTAESRLYWSTIKSPTSWPANNFIDVDKDRGKVSSLYAFGNELIVFKTGGMYKVVGDVFDPANPTYAVYPISTPAGFHFNGNRCIADHRGQMVFLAGEQMYSYVPGSNTITLISDRFWPDLFTAMDSVRNAESAEQAAAMISFNGYLLVIGINRASGNARLGGLLDRAGKWWRLEDADEQSKVSSIWSNFQEGMLAVQSGTSGRRPRVISAFFGIDAALYAYDLEGPSFENQYIDTDTGAEIGIAANWTSKEFMVGYTHFQKLVIYLAKQSAGSLTVSYSIDQGTFVDTTVDMTAGRGQILRRTIDINQKGSTIQFKLTHSTANQTFKVFGIQAVHEPIPEDRQV